VPAIVLPTVLVEAVERSASPAAVSLAISRLTEGDVELADRLEADFALREALVAVVGASRSLTQLCLTDPAAIEVLAHAAVRAPCTPDDAEGLVRWKRLEYLRIAAVDLTAQASLETTAASLAQMAEDVFRGAWRLTSGDPEGGDGPAGIAVIAMGKFGGRELNYASDVDVMFVGQGDVRAALDIARRCFRVDADLRPEGRNGPLVRTLDAFHSYWSRWANTWEFQALLKARPVAGDPDTGAAFAAAAAEAVWDRPFGAEELREVRAMKARAEGEMARRGLTDRELKRGRGGIRDIEFAVQLLQMVHGRADPALRSPTTLNALGELGAAGYVDAADAERMAAAYRFLRTVEHRLQLWDEAQVHAVPAGGDALDRLARACGYRSSESADAASAFMTDLRSNQAVARQIHERLFFRPLLESFGGVDTLSPAMSETAVTERLAAFGFADATRTRDALWELTRGLTRTSRLMQQVLPLLLGWLSEAPDPEGGLLGLRTLAASQRRAETLVRMFRDSPEGGQRLCLLLGSSRFVGSGLERHPELLADLADPNTPVRTSATELREQVKHNLRWRAPDDRVSALRRFRQYHELSAATRDLLGRDGVDEVASALTTLGEAVLGEALEMVMEGAPSRVPMAVIAMGRFGGAELSYASDLDVMLVHGGHTDEEAAAAERLAAELRMLVNGPTPAARLWALDLDLRPEGKQGPLARSLAGYEQYYRRWAQTWERQALLRGRFAVGDEELGERFAAVARDFLSRDVTDDDEREIRRMKARIERERLPATDDPDFHLKLGRGGLSDVEWTVQLLQLRHHVFGVPGTMAALNVLRGLGHIDEADADALAAAYRYGERTRNRLFLVRGAPGDALPVEAEQLGRLARSLGTSGPELREEYRRVTRRSREVTERLFYGAAGAPRRPRIPGTWSD
jgi:glutamate-ammonia-ligase adenylyltransferase